MKPLVRTALASAVLFAVTGPSADAGVTIDIAGVGADVVVTASGSLSITALTEDLGNFLASGTGMVDFGGDLLTSQGLLLGASGGAYTLISGPSFSGPAYPFFGAERSAQEQVFFSSASGDLLSLGFQGTSGRVGIAVANGYVSGAPLSAAGTWTGIGLDRLGVAAGDSFTWTWGSGAEADFLTINAIPEPSSYALMIAGLGIVGLAARRRKQALGRACAPS